MKKQVVIIGGGAAGLCCGGFAGQAGLKVTILDKNANPGRKLLITGKGRCNVTNNCEADEFMKNVRSNPRFLFSATSAFPPQATMELFEGLGVPLKTERGRRVFPVSDQASDVRDALVRFAKGNGCLFRQKTSAQEILCEGNHVQGVRLTSGEVVPADCVVVATGGLSYPLTGSDGDGYRMAQELGHTVVEQKPSLVPLVTQEGWCAKVMGLSLKNVTLTLIGPKGKPVYQELGEMLFTHFGVSGPLVLSASSYIKGDPKTYQLLIDLKPGLTPQQLDARLLRDFGEFKNKDFSNALDKLLPKKLIPVMVELSGIPGATKVNEVTKEQRGRLAALVKGLPLTIKGLGPMEEAVITAGGVSVKEIDPKTMESKLVKGLYFVGEVLDVDAFTGGYNLQIAWETAYSAAQGMAAV